MMCIHSQSVVVQEEHYKQYSRRITGIVALRP